MKKYHENEMLQARTRLAESNILTHSNTREDEDNDAIRSQLADKKAAVVNAWKTTWQPGLSISGSQSFSGRFNIANALSLYLSVTGAGILTHCFSTSSTELNGNVIAHSCELKGNVIINAPASFASFDNCLLGNIRYNGRHEPTIELLDTIVDGSITFGKF